MKYSEQFIELFTGNQRHHGSYDLKQVRRIQNKVKGRAVTHVGPPTRELYFDHLKGVKGLGVVPIMDDDTCVFAALDIDTYDISFKDFLSKLKDTPFVPCSTKSGGLHLYVFFKKPEDCGKVFDTLRAISVKLGYGDCEVFPKQKTIDPDTDDAGSWINLPYFNYKQTNRPCVDMETQEHLDFKSFITLVERKLTTVKELKNCKIQGPKIDELSVVDGPPCLEHLTQAGFPTGSRNNALLALGVYYKLKNPDNFEHLIEKANRKWMNPGTAEEVATIKRTLKRKDYKYKCNDQPLCNHCDRGVCMTRKFGIGDPDGVKYPTIDRVVKFLSYPPRYYVEINGVKLGPVESEVFLQQFKFKKMCLEGLNLIVPSLKGSDWDKLMASVMSKIEEVEVGEENSVYGQLMEYFTEFTHSHRLTDNKSEILVGRVYKDKKNIYFRMRDFEDFLKSHDFKELKSQDIVSYFKDKKFENKQLRIEKQNVRVWGVPHKDKKQTELKVPQQPEIL